MLYLYYPMMISVNLCSLAVEGFASTSQYIHVCWPYQRFPHARLLFLLLHAVFLIYQLSVVWHMRFCSCFARCISPPVAALPSSCRVIDFSHAVAFLLRLSIPRFGILICIGFAEFLYLHFRAPTLTVWLPIPVLLVSSVFLSGGFLDTPFLARPGGHSILGASYSRVVYPCSCIHRMCSQFRILIELRQFPGAKAQFL